MDRFKLEYDKSGAQKHNLCIGNIAKAVNKYCEMRGVRLDHPKHTYSLLCYNRELLLYWKKILEKEGLL